MNDVRTLKIWKVGKELPILILRCKAISFIGAYEIEATDETNKHYSIRIGNSDTVIIN